MLREQLEKALEEGKIKLSGDETAKNSATEAPAPPEPDPKPGFNNEETVEDVNLETLKRDQEAFINDAVLRAASWGIL